MGAFGNERVLAMADAGLPSRIPDGRQSGSGKEPFRSDGTRDPEYRILRFLRILTCVGMALKQTRMTANFAISLFALLRTLSMLIRFTLASALSCHHLNNLTLKI